MLISSFFFLARLTNLPAIPEQNPAYALGIYMEFPREAYSRKIQALREMPDK
jgi:hypothetical protein